VRTGWFDTSAIPDPAAWLTDKLGMLARCEIHPAETTEIDMPGTPAPEGGAVPAASILETVPDRVIEIDGVTVRIDTAGKRWIGPHRATPGIIRDSGEAPVLSPDAMFPATVIAAPGEIEEVTEFRIGNRALRACGQVIALGTPGFGLSRRDNTPPLIGNGGCSDEIEEAYVPFDYGQADRRFEKYRQTPDILRKPLPGGDLEEIAV
jgi:hypothetical protein